MSYNINITDAAGPTKQPAKKKTKKSVNTIPSIEALMDHPPKTHSRKSTTYLAPDSEAST